MTMNMLTLFTSLAMVCVVTSAFTWFLHAYNRNIHGIFAIACSNTCFAAGFWLIVFRGSLSGFVSFIVANSLIAIGHILIIVGIQQFVGRKTNATISLIIFIVYMLDYSYWYYADDNFRNRLIVFLTAYAIMMLYALTLTLSEYRKSGLKSYFISTLFIGTLAILFFASAVMSVFGQHGYDILAVNAINESFVLEHLFFMVGWTLSFSLMVSERLYTEKSVAEDRLQFLATHDPLTELPNRMLFMDRTEQAMQVAERKGTKVAILFFDLDGFKSLNDTHGHQIGDGLLREVAIRLRECVRKTDTVCRQGGDEFLLLLTDLPDADAAQEVSMNILDAFKTQFDIGDLKLSASASIGISLFPDDGADYETLLKKSDLAMYHAKDDGRNTTRFYDPKIDVDEAERRRIISELHVALERQEFELHYQPQFDLANRRLIGAEALLRWNHPVNGLVSPGSFIPLAESSGLIVDIGAWVLREACAQAASWHADGLPGLVVAVNLSAIQFRRDDLVRTVTDAISAAGISPRLLELELTESILIRDTDTVLATVNRLRSLGLKLSIDDFGTGYSSLSYLKRFNVDKVKIDQSFIRNIATDQSDAAIVKSICAMVHSLNLKVIAEGVEDESHLVPLREYLCDEVQGHYFARPMPPAEFSRRAATWLL